MHSTMQGIVTIHLRSGVAGFLTTQKNGLPRRKDGHMNAKCKAIDKTTSSLSNAQVHELSAF